MLSGAHILKCTCCSSKHVVPALQVVSACMVLCAPAGKIPKDVSWNAGKKSMGNVDAFLKSLINFDKDLSLIHISEPTRPY